LCNRAMAQPLADRSEGAILSLEQSQMSNYASRCVFMVWGEPKPLLNSVFCMYVAKHPGSIPGCDNYNNGLFLFFSNAKKAILGV